MGKNSRDWRGTAIAFRSSTAKHTNSALLPGGISTTLTPANPKHRTRFISGHIPHHATMAQTEELLGGWHSALTQPKVVVGFDANETFTDPDDQGWRAHTGRGELVLTTMAEHNLEGSPQDLHTPTYHPYNTAMESRRLDYLMTKGAQCDSRGGHSGQSAQSKFRPRPWWSLASPAIRQPTADSTSPHGGAGALRGG